jgi:hypothetical protein
MERGRVAAPPSLDSLRPDRGLSAQYTFSMVGSELPSVSDFRASTVADTQPIASPLFQSAESRDKGSIQGRRVLDAVLPVSILPSSYLPIDETRASSGEPVQSAFPMKKMRPQETLGPSPGAVLNPGRQNSLPESVSRNKSGELAFAHRLADPCDRVNRRGNVAVGPRRLLRLAQMAASDR